MLENSAEIVDHLNDSRIALRNNEESVITDEEINSLKSRDFTFRTDIINEIGLWHDRLNPRKYLIEYYKGRYSIGSTRTTLICPDRNCGFNISIRYAKGFWKICSLPNFVEQLFHKPECPVGIENGDSSSMMIEPMLETVEHSGAQTNGDDEITALKSKEFSTRAEILNEIRLWQSRLNPPKHLIGCKKKTRSNTRHTLICPDENCSFTVSIQCINRNKVGHWKIGPHPDYVEQLCHSANCTVAGKSRLIRASASANADPDRSIHSDADDFCLAVEGSSEGIDLNEEIVSTQAILPTTTDDLELAGLRARDFSCRTEIVHAIKIWHDRLNPQKSLVTFKRKSRQTAKHTLICPDPSCGFNISMQCTTRNRVGSWRIGPDPDFSEQLFHKQDCIAARCQTADDDGNHSTSAQESEDAYNLPSNPTSMENLGILASCAQILDGDGNENNESRQMENASNEEEIAALKSREFRTRPEIVHAISLWQGRLKPPKHLIGFNKSRCSSRHTLICPDRNCGFNISIQSIIRNKEGVWKVGTHPDFVEQLVHRPDCRPPAAGKVRLRVAADILHEKGTLDLDGKALMEKSKEMGFKLGRAFFSKKRFELLKPAVKKKYSKKEKERAMKGIGQTEGGNGHSSFEVAGAGTGSEGDGDGLELPMEGGQEDSANWQKVCTKTKMHLDKILDSQKHSGDHDDEDGIIDMDYFKQHRLVGPSAVTAKGRRGQKRKAQEWSQDQEHGQWQGLEQGQGLVQGQEQGQGEQLTVEQEKIGVEIEFSSSVEL